MREFDAIIIIGAGQAGRSPMMPEPTTVASSIAVPRASAVARLSRSI